MILSVTGYVGVGKSTVAKLFSQQGYVLIDVDTIGHALIKEKEIKDKLVAAFGIDILVRDLEIDRQKLRDIVFKDDLKVKNIDKIIHPRLIESLDLAVAESGSDIIIDVALYKELSVNKHSDKTILVTADLQNVYDRLNPRFSKEEVLSMMNNQDIITSADYIIENNRGVDDLRRVVEKIIEEI